ncbi:cobalamin B12-binding domain-containing protein [Alkalicella caledoniensis]|uniref:Cobalamin B12-binding domain-containing protein n=1 Tax=Alkalicella caledoniensis TaxID=2731377 RepID=A0A7G9W8W5_ALKCA|nr:OAM dimerization domain-containing protein [Alkalicella caledoniensis]QNO15127.1 cobalamin B12-binding domain-containing protein [Alkalicella caledoniensis]
MEVDLTCVKPYGDTLNDGAIQLSFTLPIHHSDEAREAAIIIAKRMGLEEPSVVHMQDLGTKFTFFVIYGKCQHSVDFTKVKVAKVEQEVMDYYEINQYIRENIKRKITVVAACTGTDAHTVGIDAIMNMKGYAGKYGLERYPEIEAINMGSQVPNEELVAKAIEANADGILVSQVVTQKNVHIPNMTELVEILEAEGMRDKIVLIAGGPRINHELAIELGYDAGFGPGTTPPDVATFIVKQMMERRIK